MLIIERASTVKEGFNWREADLALWEGKGYSVLQNTIVSNGDAQLYSLV